MYALVNMLFTSTTGGKDFVFLSRTHSLLHPADAVTCKLNCHPKDHDFGLLNVRFAQVFLCSPYFLPAHCRLLRLRSQWKVQIPAGLCSHRHRCPTAPPLRTPSRGRPRCFSTPSSFGCSLWSYRRGIVPQCQVRERTSTEEDSLSK